MPLSDTGVPNISFIDLTSYVGLAATGLLTFNLLLGLLLSTRYNPVKSWPRRRRPLYGLHNWTGYIALATVLLHPALAAITWRVRYGMRRGALRKAHPGATAPAPGMAHEGRGRNGAQ
jgi:predicted ferric reductase